MPQNRYVRLRQVCLATLDIRKEEAALSRILGLEPCHTSVLDHFGLENSLFAVNGSFIELVAPTRENTAVHRFLDRSGGLGGYMAIFDCADVSLRKTAAAKLGIEPVFERSDTGADLLQLNPRQTGVTLLEFDHHQKGDDRFGHYEWAGTNWQSGINTELTKDMISITMSCNDPYARAEQWSALFGKDVSEGGSRQVSLPLDYGNLYFEPGTDGIRDHFSSLQLSASSPDTVLANALTEGYAVADNAFSYCGVDIEVVIP